MSTSVFKILKMWQLGKNRLQWSLVEVGTTTRNTKVFAIITVSGQQISWAMSTEKSPDIPITHAFNDILKKHISGYVLSRVSSNDDHICFSLHQPGQAQASFVLLGSLTKPATLELIDLTSNISIARITETACFTKRRAIEGQLPEIVSNISSSQNLLNRVNDRIETNEAVEELEADETTSASDITLCTEQRELIDQLKRRLRTLKRTLLKRQKQIVDDKAIARLKQEAELLKRYSYLVKEGDFALELPSHFHDSEHSISISLNPELSAGENLNDRYAALKKLSRGSQQQRDQLAKHELSVLDLQNELDRLKVEPITNSEMTQLRQRWHIAKIAQQEDSDEPSSFFRTFKCHGIRMRVGKGAAGNDRLNKIAKANDFWLHAVGATGSHVIVDGKTFKNDLPTSILQDAAILAIHFSKRRQDRASEVYVTRRHGISKKKGMPIGLWSVDKAKSLFFRYEVDDLQRVLNQMEAE